MTTQNQTSPATKKISTYLMMIIFIVLALSIVSLVLAAQAYLANDVISAGFLALIGLVALSVSVFVMFQSRRQAVEMKIEVPKVMTTMECNNKSCASKTLREFQRGDYVFKDLDVPCPKCSGKQMISAIYKEVKEKEKTFNV